MRGAAEAAARPEGSLTEPSLRGILLPGLPRFLREGLLPLGAFYAGLKLDGLAAGVVASAVMSLLIYLYERRAGHHSLFVRLSLAFVGVQAATGLLSHSATVYLAQPVLVTTVWGFAFLLSVPLGRPLSGTLAYAWYPFPPALRETASFKRVFGTISLVWAAYFLARSAFRLAILLHGALGSFLAITFVTGTPVTLVLLAWSIRYSIRSLSD